MNGMLLILKPPGMTSHDVVAWLRRRLGRRVGHAGTLDRQAAGLLLCCVGAATRLTEYLVRLDKSYRMEFTFGIATETGDAEGKVTTCRDASRLTPAEVRQHLERFRGTVRQRVPRYAAVKVGGERLYRLARRGEQVVPPEREVRIHRLELLHWWPGEHPRALVDMRCSSGTYARALARDLGEALGCGAHLSFLVRTRVGPFSLREATLLEQVAQADAVERLMVPMAEVLWFWPRVTVTDRQLLWRLRHGDLPVRDGQALAAQLSGHAEGGIRIVDDRGNLVAVGRMEHGGRTGRRLRLEKVFAP